MSRLWGAALAAVLAMPVAVSAGDHAAADHGTQADNTGKNVRDRDSDRVVPTDQAKGGEGDVETTRKIRQAIVADDTLSMNAHNVKIVTLAGVTTLRGPVKTAEEKKRVAELAASASGGSNHVKNELEVAP